MATEGSVANDVGAPESWEVADLDESMNRLMLSTSNKDKHKDSTKSIHDQLAHGSGPGSASVDFAGVVQKVDDIVINQVDQFLREALQNPRERLSVLRMEQDIEKFIRDPMQQQMEFQQLPTSYLRLAAHRVAQHYSLQSMVLLDSSLPDGSGSRIIVCKNSECRLPAIRLADIHVNLPSEESGVTKVAIKQRPQKNSTNVNNTNSNSSSSGSKSVEERKEEYSKARARIFNSSNNVSGGASGKPETESRLQANTQHGSLCISKIEEKFIPNCSNISAGRGIIADSSTNSRAARTRTEMEPLGRYRPNNRVAIFRDRDVERNDPDYDRSYDRYMQRYDPGFGFNGGPYTIQPMYTSAINYNTEFPQLASTCRPQISAEPQPCPLPQHLPVPWVAQSARAGIGYAHPETIMTQYSPNHVGAHSTSGVYLHSSHYPCQRPGMPFIHPQEHVHHPFLQSHRQPDASFGLARPR